MSLRQKNDEQLKGRSRKYGFAPIRRKMHIEKYDLSSAIIETIFFQKITIFLKNHLTKRFFCAILIERSVLV